MFIVQYPYICWNSQWASAHFFTGAVIQQSPLNAMEPCDPFLPPSQSTHLNVPWA